ncbi:hypothetical protein C0995_007392 [Termitomyces sp. Mi166|nr:hypothetical protein C0995_007392 [Termitomyces sp. Mi166\
MSTSFDHDSWSPPTTPTNTSTAAPLPITSGQASGTPPILGEGLSATPVGTAKYWACVSQMELMITGILACLAAIEEGLQITSIAAQTASKHSSALAPASKAPPPSLKTSTASTSRIPQRVVQSRSNAPLAIPLAWELPPTNGQAQRYECMLEIPDSLVSHVIRHQGRGLKQAHNLSSSWLVAFVVGPAGNEGRWFVTIRSTDQQIGKALLVIGKRITKH